MVTSCPASTQAAKYFPCEVLLLFCGLKVRTQAFVVSFLPFEISVPTLGLYRPGEPPCYTAYGRKDHQNKLLKDNLEGFSILTSLKELHSRPALDALGLSECVLAGSHPSDAIVLLCI